METTQQTAPREQAVSSASDVMVRKEDSYSYRGWLTSDFFWKRMLGVVGYNFLGALVIYACFFLLTILLAVIVGTFFIGRTLLPSF